MKSLSQSFYSQLSETAETQFAKTVSELQSEVREQQLLIYLSSGLSCCAATVKVKTIQGLFTSIYFTDIALNMRCVRFLPENVLK